jgi:hypothetical protein
MASSEPFPYLWAQHGLAVFAAVNTERRGGKMSPVFSSLTITSWIIFLGGLLVLLGSYRQAKNELTAYWLALEEPDREKIKSQRGFVHSVLTSQDTGAFMQIARTASVGFLSLAKDEIKSDKGQKALKSAIAWGLILIGSLAASLAGAYQAAALTLPHLL